MNKTIAIIIIVLGFFVNAQEKSSYRKMIDSIQSDRWNSHAPNMDSLANAHLENLSAKFKDTIITRNKLPDLIIVDQIPITPFQLNKENQSKKWLFFAQHNLTINQASFSNWNSGGNDNFGIIAKLYYNLSYKNNNHFLENILQTGYGFLASKGQSNRKTEDFINFMSNYGYDLGRNYYLSTGFQFLTQYTAGFNYNATPDPEFSDRISKFMAPAYLNMGLGISYNPNENFQLIVRPLNGKFTFVTDPYLQKAGRYGLERDGQSVRTELGAMINCIYRLKIYKDIYLDNQLNFFSNYLYHTERVDVAYNGNLNINFNKFISTVISLDLLYDHDQITDLQRKQTLGIGFLYKIGEPKKEKDNRKKIIKPFIAN